MARSSRCRRDTDGSGTTTSQPRLRPTTILPWAGSDTGAAGARAVRQRGHVRPLRATSARSTRSSAAERARSTHPRRYSKVSMLR